MRGLAGHILYLALMAVSWLLAMGSDIAHVSQGLLVVGVLGIWRYSWAALNFARAALYIGYAFPRLRARAEAAYAAKGVPAHAFFLVTSYKIDTATNDAGLRSVFRAAAASEGGRPWWPRWWIRRDARLIRTGLSGPKWPAPAGCGCASTGFRAPASATRWRGRSGLSRARRRRATISLPWWMATVACRWIWWRKRRRSFTDPRVGALTTDEEVEISTPGWFRDWFRLRFTQRQIMMSSMGLSGRC